MTTSEAQNGILSTDSNEEQSSSPRRICTNIITQCAHHLLLIIYRFFSDCLPCRILSFVFTLQAGIIWLGFALNFILQLLFLPFGQHRVRTLIGSYLMIPGTVAFSAHYFWYILQTACHTLRSNLGSSVDKRDYLLVFVNSNVMAKRVYRLIITFLTIGYMIYYCMGDSWRMMIVPAGEIPLILMWALNVTHLIGMVGFVVYSSPKLHVIEREPFSVSLTGNWKSMISIVLLQIVIPLILQLLAVFHRMVWFVLFIIWLLLFGRAWPPGKNQCIYLCFCCCCRRNNENREMTDHALEKRSKRLMTSKLFILFVLSSMNTSLSFVLRSHIDLNLSERVTAVSVLVIAGLFEILLLIPPYLVVNFIRIQILVINILMMTACILVLVGVGILLFDSNSNIRIVIACLVPLIIYLLLLFIYYLYHTIYDGIHRHQRYISGLCFWIGSHHEISIFRNAFYAIFAVMIVLGFTGLALCSSVFFQDEIRSDNQTLFGDVHLNETARTKENPMKACNWQFHSLKIQDMVLLSALAYRPTKKVKVELEKFFGSSMDLQFKLDEELSNYREYGYGDVTYFTVTTADMVIVSIRGTKLLYEWLIDFDTWTESFIYQIISMLFPWSKLFPEQLTSKIIHHMALLKKLSHRSDQSKRFYALQMIQILERIYQKYQTKQSFIVVGHSLGGGLAKLSGIALNFTDILISVSGPGITHAHATVDQTKDIPMETINRRIFNIYHDRDLVPWTDKQEGLIQIVTCPREFKRIQCHSVTPLFCHVVRICGNPRGFKINPNICVP